MEFKISSLAVKKPVPIYLLILLIVVVGWLSYQSLPRESNPDIQFPYLEVYFSYSGASPVDVEEQVTNKAEPELSKVENLKAIDSTSFTGGASISMEFELGTDIKKARNDIREALGKVDDLPDGVDDPSIYESNTSDEPIITVGVSGDLDMITLKEIANDLKQRLGTVTGILEIELHGGLSREVVVLVDPKKLEYYQIDLSQIGETIRDENANIPGGSMKIGPMDYLVRVPGEITSIDEINSMILDYHNHAPILVQDVATVSLTTEEPDSYSGIDGRDAITLQITKRRGANVTNVAEQVKEIVADEEKKYNDNVRFHIMNDRSLAVSDFVNQLENNIIMGVLLVTVVLFLFMGGRNALLVGTAIPLSMLMSFIILSWVGITLNTVVLFSLILALGMLVDNAIVVVENIYRHFQSGKSRTEAAIKGVSEVALPVISSTLTTLLAFVPLIFLPGITGEFLAYIPKTLIITLSCSLIVGLIFNPVIASTLMKKKKKGQGSDELELARRSKLLTQYSKILRWSLQHPWFTLLALICFWGGVMVYYFMLVNPYGARTEFFPPSEPEMMRIKINTPPGSVLDTTKELVEQIEQSVESFKKYTTNILTTVEKESGTVLLFFPRWEERRNTFLPSKISENIRKSIPEISGAGVILRGGGGGPGSSQAFEIELTGDDFKEMSQFTKEIEQEIKNTPGLVNLENSLQSERDEIRVLIDRQKIAAHGLRTRHIASMIRTAINGEEVSNFRKGQEEYPVMVRFDEQYRQYDEDLNTLLVNTPDGELIPLGELARIKRVPSMGAIRHVKSKRVVRITGDSSKGISGRMILETVKQKMEMLHPPRGITVSFEGENREKEELQDELTWSFWIAIGLIFIVLVSQFNSLVLPFIIILSIFASLGGVFLGMSIHDQPISILIGGIGIVSLAGVVVNNAIVLIDYIRQLRERGIEITEAIVLAGMVRLRPVALTAITTILGVLPIFLGVDIDFFRPVNDMFHFGAESGKMWYPMNLAMIYGLGVATFLTLFMVPVLYYLNEQAKTKIGNLIGKMKNRSHSLEIEEEELAEKIKKTA